MQTLLYNKKTDSYVSETHVVERDHQGKGNWVFKDKATNKVIDTDLYRNDLAERNDLKLGSSVDTGSEALS